MEFGSKQLLRRSVARGFLAAVLLGAAAPAAGVVEAATCPTPNVLSGSSFEIDVNANLKVDGAACIDWLTGGSGTAMRSDVFAKPDAPSGASDDAFGQGTSENDANPTIVDGSIPPNKSDLKVFGVHTEVGTPSASNPTGKFLQLFWSRVQNPSGTTNMDFELNQKFCNPSGTPTNCANNGAGVTPETPLRTIGDQLITYDLSKGGTVPTISVRTWNGTVWGPAAVISGGVNPTALGSVNTSPMVAGDTGGIGSQDAFTFGEVSLAFGAIFGSGTTCGSFGSAYLKSRSSDSFTAEIKDFIAPEQVTITNCSSISTSLSASSVVVGSTVHDSATLSGATSNAGGTVTYTVYSNNTCTAGAQSGGTKTVANGLVPDSDAITFNSVGDFFWQAVYSGDANNAGSTSACTSEHLTVTKASPSISTGLSATSVSIGTAVHDSATLSKATSDAGGSVTYTVYTDTACTLGAQSAGTKTVTNGVVPDSDAITFNSAGDFYWQAVYSGDSNNNGATSTCTSEHLVVNTNPTQINTTLSGTSVSIGAAVHDSATLSGQTSNAGGTVTYTVYTDSNCTTGAQSAGTKAVTNGLVTDSDAITFNNAGTFYWQAVYSGDANNQGATSTCSSEVLVVNPNAPGIATAQNLLPNDSATISGATSNAGGKITFNLFRPSDATCSGAPAYTQQVNVNGNGTYSTTNTTFLATDTGTWRWQVAYSGDNNNIGASSACGVENFTITNS